MEGKPLKNEKLLTRQIDLIGPMRSVGFSALDLELIRGEPSLREIGWIELSSNLKPIYSDLMGKVFLDCLDKELRFGVT